MSGSIDSKFAISATLECNGTNCDGTYQYTGIGKPIPLRGTLSKTGALTLAEFGEGSKTTGTFSGKLRGNKCFSGTWSNPKKDKSMPFLLANVNDPSALNNGVDGIILSRATKSVAKTGGVSTKATLIYPVVMVKPWGDPAVNNKTNAAISLKRVLKQSAEDFIAAVKSGDNWLDSIDYVVDYNKNNLLSLDFTMEGCGAYPSASVEHVLVDTSTGKPVLASDAFTDAGRVALKALLEKEMRAEMASVLKENPDEKETLNGIFEYAPKLAVKELLPFSVSDAGLTFICDWGFPHVALALEPDGKYFIPFSRLRSYINKSGPLAVFVK